MPLSQPSSRELRHTRRVECRGYRRQDGLWDIEGHLTDNKSYAFDNRWRGRIEPDMPVHEMWLRLTIDRDMVIRAVEAVTDNGPYRICPDIIPAYQSLVGLRIAPGFTAETRRRLGGAAGCTHLTELLGPIATTAYQTLVGAPDRSVTETGEPRRPPIDACHAMSLPREARC
jgi:hypothetical protein